MTALVDTGFLYSLLDESDDDHVSAMNAFAEIPGPWLLPSPAMAEFAYLVMKFLGPFVLASFLEDFSTSSLLLIEPVEEDYSRAGQLIRQYHDAPLELVDALIVAIAERLNIVTILTVDRRHFYLVRPRHVTAFEVFP
jgi:uncharacterized protein